MNGLAYGVENVGDTDISQGCMPFAMNKYRRVSWVWGGNHVPSPGPLKWKRERAAAGAGTEVQRGGCCVGFRKTLESLWEIHR